MSIQANINQGISLAGFLAQTNPYLQEKSKTRRELKSLSKQEAAVKSAQDIVTTKEAKSNVTDPTNMAQLHRMQDELAGIKERQFRLEPSDEAYEEFQKVYGGTKQGMAESGFRESGSAEITAKQRFTQEQEAEEVNKYLQQYRDAAKKAQDNLAAKQNEKRASRRRNFANYHDNLLRSQGFDPTKIPKETKAEMMKEYSKSERKKIMDKEDLNK